MKLRIAREEDFAAVVGLYRQLQPADPVLTDGSDREVYSAILGDKRLNIIVLEDERGELVATCYLNVIPNITRSASPYGVIENVVTEESLRGSGFGTQVVEHALELAWSAGCYKVMLQTGSQRESVHAFYQSCGFSGDDKRAFIAWRPGWERPARPIAGGLI